MAEQGTERTPLGQPDPDRVAEFWQRFLAAEPGCKGPAETALGPPEAWAFGDSAEMANQLLTLVLDRTKQATAGALADYEADDEPIAEVDDFEIITDGAMRPRAVIQITDVRVGPLSSVDDRFAYDEGEGDRSRDYWLEAHTRFFSRRMAQLGLEFDADMAVVFERFKLVYSED